MEGNEEIKACEYELNCSTELKEIMSKIDSSGINLIWYLDDEKEYLHGKKIRLLNAGLDEKIRYIKPLADYLGCAVSIESFVYGPDFLEERYAECMEMYGVLSKIDVFRPEMVSLELYLEADLPDVEANGGHFNQTVSRSSDCIKSSSFDSGYFFLEKEQFKNILNKYLNRPV